MRKFFMFYAAGIHVVLEFFTAATRVEFLDILGSRFEFDYLNNSCFTVGSRYFYYICTCTVVIGRCLALPETGDLRSVAI